MNDLEWIQDRSGHMKLIRHHMLLREFISNKYSADKKKKKKHNVRVELNFTWGKIRTAAQETVPQTVLSDCSKEVG